MSSRLGRRLALLTLMLAGGTGCARAYRPPTASEPHATVKVRRAFERSAGTMLKESLHVNGHVAEHETAEVALAKAPRTSALLVHPRPAKVSVGGGFVHVEQRLVQESYTVQVPYSTTESYSCGFGKTYQTCTRSVTHYRSETRYQTVLRNVEVSDGWCAQTFSFSPRVGHIFVIDYTYRDNGVCSVTCLQQAAIFSDGSFQSVPCPALTADEAGELANEQ